MAHSGVPLEAFLEIVLSAIDERLGRTLLGIVVKKCWKAGRGSRSRGRRNASENARPRKVAFLAPC